MILATSSVLFLLSVAAFSNALETLTARTSARVIMADDQIPERDTSNNAFRNAGVWLLLVLVSEHAA